jgi:hypothetical protein
MKMNFKKIIPTICAIAGLSILSSCNNEDDKIPCTDQELAAFHLILEDEEGNKVFDEEAFDLDHLSLVYILEEETIEVEFEIKESSAEVQFLSSLEMTELSLEDGISEFELRMEDQILASIDYSVSSKTTDGCISFEYVAKNGSENLDKITSGDISVFVYKIELTEE